MPAPGLISIFDNRIPVDGEALIFRIATDNPGHVSSRIRFEPATSLDRPEDRSTPQLEFAAHPRVDIQIGGVEGLHVWIIRKGTLNAEGTQFTAYDGNWDVYLFLNESSPIPDFEVTGTMRFLFQYGTQTQVLAFAALITNGKIGTIGNTEAFSTFFLASLKAVNSNYNLWTTATLRTGIKLSGTTVGNRESIVGVSDTSHARVSGGGDQWRPNQIVTPDEIVLAEGETAEYDVALRYPPIGGAIVRPNPTASDNIIYTVAELHFDDGEQGPKNFSVQALLDDDIADHTRDFAHVATSPDLFLENEETRITATDPNAAHVLITATILRIVDGGSGMYGVRLLTEPEANVVISISIAERTGNIGINKSSLTFTPSNWSTVQAVTVTSIADAETDLHFALIEHSATSADDEYNGILIPNVLALEVDAIQPVVVEEGPEIPLPPGARRGVYSKVPGIRVPEKGYIEVIERDLVKDTLKITVRETDF